AGRPGFFEAADGPRSPNARIRWAKEGNGAASRGCGKMSDRCVRPDIDARSCKKIHHYGPFYLMNGSDAVPDIIKVTALGFTRTADRDYGKTALCKTGGERAPSVAGPFLVGKHRRCMNQSIIAISNFRRGR